METVGKKRQGKCNSSVFYALPIEIIAILFVATLVKILKTTFSKQMGKNPCISSI
jgi:hypothetical protein